MNMFIERVGMKVSELVKNLSEFNQNSDVLIWDNILVDGVLVDRIETLDDSPILIKEGD